MKELKEGTTAHYQTKEIEDPDDAPSVYETCYLWQTQFLVIIEECCNETIKQVIFNIMLSVRMS